MWLLCLVLKSLAACLCVAVASQSSSAGEVPSWVVHLPADFREKAIGQLTRSHSLRNFNHATYMMYRNIFYVTDGGGLDAAEKYFYRQSCGVAMELGALGGRYADMSETVGLAQNLNWRRVLVEAGPQHVLHLKEHRNDFSVNCVIADVDPAHPKVFHYAQGKFASGILEFMTPSFIKEFHRGWYALTSPPGDVSSIDFEAVDYEQNTSDAVWLRAHKAHPVHAVSLQQVLDVGNVSHVNLFFLDVEGAEIDVLRTVDFKRTTFDVLVVETEALYRPVGFFEELLALLEGHGYVCDHRTVGRNSWFRRQDFRPTSRPGRHHLDNCFPGHEKAAGDRGRRKVDSNCTDIKLLPD